MLYLLMSLEMAYRLSSQSKSKDRQSRTGHRCGTYASSVYDSAMGPDAPARQGSGSRRQCQRNLQAVCRFLFLDSCLSASHWLTVENPLHSWLWHLPPFQELLQKCVLVSFDDCLHGSRCNKATALLTTVEGVGDLSGPCPGCESHEPWGRTPDGFATAAEAAYPRLLCDRILQCVDLFAAATDASPAPLAITPLAETRAAAQKAAPRTAFRPHHQ